MNLMVEKSSWSGWNEDYKPNVETEQFNNLKSIFRWETILKTSVVHGKGEIRYNGEITSISKAEVKFFSFIVMELGEDYIIIKTNCPMNNGSNDGKSSLRSNENTFRLDKYKKLKLITPTKDAGDMYTFELKD